MKKHCLITLFAVLLCAAQQPMFGMESEGHAPPHSGVRQFIVPVSELNSGHAGIGKTVSLWHLRHKVPRDAEKAFVEAQKLSFAGEHGLAAEELERAVALDAGFAEAHAGLGGEYAQLGRISDAERELKQAIALDASSSSYYNLGLLYFRTGDMRAAEMNVRKALEFPDREPTTHLLLAYILMRDPAKREETERHLRYAARTIPQAGYLLTKLQEIPKPHS